MKRVFIIPFVFLFINNISSAFQNEPDDFRGIRLGTKISNFTDLVPVVQGPKDFNRCLPASFGRDDNFKCFTKQNEKLSIKKAKLDSIVYLFEEDVLREIIIYFYKSANLIIIKSTLVSNFGKPNKSDKGGAGGRY